MGDPGPHKDARELLEDCLQLVREAQAQLDRGASDPESARRCAEARRLVGQVRRALDPSAGPAPPASAGAPAPLPAGRPVGMIESFVARLAHGLDFSSKSDPDQSFAKPKSPGKTHTLALQGIGRVIPIAELLSFLGSMRKTGIVHAATDRETFTLEVENGALVHACSDNSPKGARLGDVLVAIGAVDREKMESHMKDCASGRLGDLLERGELVTHDQLRKALERQTQMLFDRLFRAIDVQFSFWKGPPKQSDGRIRLNVMQLLLESARSQDEEESAGRPFRAGLGDSAA